MITLYQFPPVWGLPNASPFCMKLETWLRMAQLPYRYAPNADVRRAPKKKFPCIEDDGKIIADSGFIIDYLERKYDVALDRHLDRRERAQMLAWRRLMEESLYWCVVYTRWIPEDNWKRTRADFFSPLPPLVRGLVATLVRRSMRRELYMQGTGRHTPEEIYTLGNANLTALSDFLADKPFFMGVQPTSLDATGYAFIGNLLWAPTYSPMVDHARLLPNLEPYCQRMKQRYYG